MSEEVEFDAMMNYGQFCGHHDGSPHECQTLV